MADSSGATLPDPLTGAGLNWVDGVGLAGQIKDEQAQASATAAAEDPEDPSGGINPRTFDARIRAAHQAAQQAIGTGYQFSPAQIEKNIADATDLIHLYRADQNKILRIIAVKPPAPDPASVAHAAELSNRGQQAMARNESQINFLTAWIQRLQNAKTAYLSQEHLTVLP